jgi:predicted Zn finger-like uncharacterized protein
MKFLCSHCKAKYQIADEKVAGRALRMTCRNCKQEIVIHGDAGAAAGYITPSIHPIRSPAPPSPLGADFQMQVANLRAPPLPQPIDEWHVGINDVPVGPMRREEVARKLAAGVIHPESLAWREGLDDWLPIRMIPELAVLCVPAMPVSHPSPPLHAPAQRADLAPIGGRAGAAPAYSVEDWAPVIAPVPVIDPNPSQVSQVAINPMLERRAPGMPSLGGMFALVGAFALLTSGLILLGTKWLQEGQRPTVVTAPVAAPALGTTVAPTQPVAQANADPADTTGAMVIGLDEASLQDRATAGKARGGAALPMPQVGKKKELTAEQKAMLERMGGADSSSNLTNLRSQQNDGANARASNGTLSSEDVSKVVVRGRPNLQRCYETALRGAGSDQTVRMNVELVVSPSGNVASVKTSGDGLLPGMAQCIERTVRMWRFPSSGDSSPVKFPLLFAPGS